MTPRKTNQPNPTGTRLEKMIIYLANVKGLKCQIILWFLIGVCIASGGKITEILSMVLNVLLKFQ